MAVDLLSQISEISIICLVSWNKLFVAENGRKQRRENFSTNNPDSKCWSPNSKSVFQDEWWSTTQFNRLIFQKVYIFIVFCAQIL
uniref:Ycf15 n=1 Tax=Panagrolaimus sp. JU765 TaxID=591449 RepID=A0AC34QRV1_9BILA